MIRAASYLDQVNLDRHAPSWRLFAFVDPIYPYAQLHDFTSSLSKISSNIHISYMKLLLSSPNKQPSLMCSDKTGSVAWLLHDILHDILFGFFFGVLFNILFGFLFDILFRFLFDTLFEIFFDILFKILFDILFKILFDILFKIFFGMFFQILFKILFDVLMDILYVSLQQPP